MSLKRAMLPVAVAAVAVAAFAGAYAYRLFWPLDWQQLSADVFVIYGFGGNVGVLRTSDGAVVVDSMTFSNQGVRVRRLAERLAGGPVRALINTHYHRDHTHGNPGFPTGIPVVATENTRRHLLERDADYWRGAAARSLPSETVVHDHVLRIGGKTVLCLVLGRGHTDGDLVVLFVEDRVLHAGDLFFNGRFPNIDLEAGGSVEAWDATLNSVAELGFDRVIPGHGPASDLEGLRRFQRFMRELWSVARRAAQSGLSLEETLETADLREARDMEVFEIPFVVRFDREFVLRRAWQEATRADPR